MITWEVIDGRLVNGDGSVMLTLPIDTIYPLDARVIAEGNYPKDILRKARHVRDIVFMVQPYDYELQNYADDVVRHLENHAPLTGHYVPNNHER